MKEVGRFCDKANRPAANLGERFEPKVHRCVADSSAWTISACPVFCGLERYGMDAQQVPRSAAATRPTSGPELGQVCICAWVVATAKSLLSWRRRAMASIAMTQVKPSSVLEKSWACGLPDCAMTARQGSELKPAALAGPELPAARSRKSADGHRGHRSGRRP